VVTLNVVVKKEAVRAKFVAKGIALVARTSHLVQVVVDVAVPAPT